MNIPWNPDDPALLIQLDTDTLQHYTIFAQVPDGWTVSGKTYFLDASEMSAFIPKEVCDLLWARHRLGEHRPAVYIRAKSGRVILDDHT